MKILKLTGAFFASFCLLVFTACENHPFVNPFDPLYVATPGLTGNAPTFDKTPGFYPPGLTITIACDDTTANIYYSLDDDIPAVNDTNLYTGPVDIDDKSTLRAITVGSDQKISLLAEGVFGVLQPPTGFSTANTDSRLINTLSWNTGTEGHEGFIIQRKTGAAGTWATIDTVGPDVLTYVDYPPEAGTDYYYRVHSYNTNGNSNDTTEILTATDSESFVTVSSPTFGYGRIYTGDLNGDGFLDIVVPDFSGDEIFRLENNGSFGFTYSAVDSILDPTDVALTDIDGDGDLDILGSTSYSTTSGLLWWENTNGSGNVWTEKTFISQPYSNCIHADDIDADGDFDIFGSSTNPNGFHVWKNTGGDPSTWTRITIDSFRPYVEQIETADMDGDGTLDVIISDYDAVYWYDNTNGDGSTWSRRDVNTSLIINEINTTDLDGDGDMDVLFVDQSNRIGWWDNISADGTAWDQRIIISSLSSLGGSAYDVLGIDLDGDGDTDILANGGNHYGRWWENDGSGNFTADNTIATGIGQISGAAVAAADMDNDGDLDIILQDNSRINVIEMVF